jgi:hypothetical protein
METYWYNLKNPIVNGINKGMDVNLPADPVHYV